MQDPVRVSILALSCVVQTERCPNTAPPPQDVAITAWAFAVMGQRAPALFAALTARTAQWVDPLEPQVRAEDKHLYLMSVSASCEKLERISLFVTTKRISDHQPTRPEGPPPCSKG